MQQTLQETKRFRFGREGREIEERGRDGGEEKGEGEEQRGLREVEKTTEERCANCSILRLLCMCVCVCQGIMNTFNNNIINKLIFKTGGGGRKGRYM